jgi:hypothetical protein
MSHNISRRGFLAGTLAASAVSPLVLPSAVLGKEGQLPPNERITIGVFGVGTYLDDSNLAQTACEVIVKLAHHRFLRQPNKAHFEPILKKVEATVRDKSIAELAEKARLGM